MYIINFSKKRLVEFIIPPLIKFIFKIFFNYLNLKKTIKNKNKKLLFNSIRFKISFQKSILIRFKIINII